MTHSKLGDDTPASVWTHAELCLGVVSACLPCFRPLFKRVGGVFTSNKSSSNRMTPQSRSRVSADPYKSLDDKEASHSGSKIALVPVDQWKSSYAPSKGKPKVDIQGGGQYDAESALPSRSIGVTRDIEVSSTAAK